jgi:hypothetical protein
MLQLVSCHRVLNYFKKNVGKRQAYLSSAGGLVAFLILIPREALDHRQRSLSVVRLRRHHCSCFGVNFDRGEQWPGWKATNTVIYLQVVNDDRVAKINTLVTSDRILLRSADSDALNVIAYRALRR